MDLPPIKLNFLKLLTDDTGILQHAKFATPRREEGYATDDNARALIACIKFNQIQRNSRIAKLIDTYLSFLLYMQKPNGEFHNFLGYNRQFMDETGSEDCAGRALWACGCAVNSIIPSERRLVAKEMFDRGLCWIPGFSSLRSKAFAVLGLVHYQNAYPQDLNPTLNITTLADQLIGNFKDVSSDDWRWFEPYLTYVNGRLPQALFEAYIVTGNKEYLQIAQNSFDFILNVQMLDGAFVPIGNKGWYRKGEQRAMFDQQSVEASCMVQAALAAFRATGKEEYGKIAKNIFHWFLGGNTKGLMVYNVNNGSCNDGITPNGLNQNQGAEAAVSYLLARLELESLE